MILIGDLNDMVSSDNTLLEHVMVRYELGDCNNNGETFGLDIFDWKKIAKMTKTAF